MTTDDTAGSLTDQVITGGTAAVFSMKQAAEVAGISVSTLRRRRTDLIAAGADISPDGWKVPITALVACGLIAGEGPGATSRPVSVAPPSGESHGSGQSRQISELTTQVRELEHEVGEWRRRAEVAEARAEERGRALDALRVANETERMALRMLTAGTSTTATMQEAEEPMPSTKQGTHLAPPHSGEPPRSAPAASPPHSSPEKSKRRGFFSRVIGM